MAYKGDRYVEEERRRSGPPAAATHEVMSGWADPRRRAALLVPRLRSARVPSEIEGLVARVLIFEYATLLAPCAACPSAQRGRGDL